MFLSSSSGVAGPTASQQSLTSQVSPSKSSSSTATQQVLFAFYVLKRQDVIYACHWTPSPTEVDERIKQKRISPEVQKENQKLLSGLLFSVKTFCLKLSPISKNPPTPSIPLFTSFTTPFYKLHYFESATGYKFVMTTAPSVTDVKDFLKSFYTELFVPFILRSPFAASTRTNSIRPEILSPLLQEFIDKKLPHLLKTLNGKLQLQTF